MPEPTANDFGGKIRVIADRIVDEAGDVLDQIRMRLRAERDAGIQARDVVKEITGLLTTPPADDPLTMIHEIEDRLGVGHYDWPKYGQWTRHLTND